jgi:hypothetical protein
MFGFWTRRSRQRMFRTDHLRPCRKVTALGLRRVKELRQQCRTPNEMSMGSSGRRTRQADRQRRDICGDNRYPVDPVSGAAPRVEPHSRIRRSPAAGVTREPRGTREPGATRHHRSRPGCAAFRRTPRTR